MKMRLINRKTKNAYMQELLRRFNTGRNLSKLAEDDYLLKSD